MNLVLWRSPAKCCVRTLVNIGPGLNRYTFNPSSVPTSQEINICSLNPAANIHACSSQKSHTKSFPMAGRSPASPVWNFKWKVLYPAAASIFFRCSWVKFSPQIQAHNPLNCNKSWRKNLAPVCFFSGRHSWKCHVSPPGSSESWSQFSTLLPTITAFSFI